MEDVLWVLSLNVVSDIVQSVPPGLLMVNGSTLSSVSWLEISAVVDTCGCPVLMTVIKLGETVTTFVFGHIEAFTKVADCH